MKRLSNLYYNKYNILVTNIISMIKVIYLDNFQKEDELCKKSGLLLLNYWINL